LEESWLVIMIGDTQIGTVKHRITKSLVGGVEYYRTKDSSTMSMDRLGSGIEVTTVVEFVESMDFKPVSFSSRLKLSEDEVRTQGTVKGDNLVFVQESSGHQTERSIPFSQEVLFPVGVIDLLKRSGLKPGTEIRYKTFLPEENVVTDVVARIGEPEEVSLLEGTAVLIPVRSTQTVMPGVTITEWVNPEADTLKGEMQIMGLTITTYKTDHPQTEKPPGVVEAPDILVETLVQIDEPLIRPRRIERLKLDVSMLRPLPQTLQVPEDERQRILKRHEKGLILEITADSAPSKTLSFADLSDSRVHAEFLQSNAYIQSDDPGIAETASHVCPASIDPGDCAYRMTDWVYSNISKKGFDVVLGSAKEVLENRKGDCSEHAVLLAALLRSRGIPARVAVGLVNVGRIFGYHMWTEAWLGKWYALDAALGQHRPDATHIKLASSSLSEGLSDIILPLYPVVNNITLVPIEYTTAGTRLKSSQPASAFSKIKGRQYQNTLLGIRFKVPAKHRISVPEGSTTILAEVNHSKKGHLVTRLEVDSIGYDFTTAAYMEDMEQIDTIKLPHLPQVGKDGALLLHDTKGEGGQCLFILEGNLYRMTFVNKQGQKTVKDILKSFFFTSGRKAD
ncbi:transglutaminase family protein, partial [Acidobacteriota bacterium]